MPNRKDRYADMTQFRRTRNAQRKRYYGKTNNRYPIRSWTVEEDNLVLAHSMTDTELSKVIQRSVQAIQGRRWKLKQCKY